MIKAIIAVFLGILIGFLFTVFLISTARNGGRKKKNKKKREFKKMLVAAVLATYFLGVAIGVFVTLKYDFSQLGSLLTFIAAPTTGAILSYCYVIRAENAIKLKQQYPKETEGYSVDINYTSV